MLYTSGETYLTDHPIHLAPLWVALATTAYVPSVAHADLTELTDELTGGGYARRPLQELRLSTDRTALFAADSEFLDLALAAGQPRYAVVYVDGATDADRVLVACIDLGATASIPRGTTYFVRWSRSGLITGM